MPDDCIIHSGRRKNKSHNADFEALTGAIMINLLGLMSCSSERCDVSGELFSPSSRSKNNLRKKQAGGGCIFLPLVPCLAYSSTLKMEVICCSETSGCPRNYPVLKTRRLSSASLNHIVVFTIVTPPNSTFRKNILSPFLLKMEAVRSSEESVFPYHTTRCYSSELYNMILHLKTQMYTFHTVSNISYTRDMSKCILYIIII
jgi:hypothetical protein